MKMEFQQYYPTYNFKERDVVLSEFEEAQKIANTQSKLYGQLANLLLAFVTIGITILVKSSDTSNIETITIVKDNIIILDCFLFVIGIVILRYFIELQRTIVINCRKVITLRGMLGLDYGHLQLTIPNWRVEGATNPFVIRLFPGWLRFGSSPFWIIMFSLNILWYLTYKEINWEIVREFWYVINILITLFFALVYRIQLNETHETFYLSFVKTLAKILRIKLIDQFEYVLYRAKLSVYEKNRLQYNTKIIEKLLVEIEDARFFKHDGIDYKSLGRSILSLSSKYRRKKGLLKNGGSTITMQLCRTLFIPSNQNVIFRKIIEMLLSKWIEQQFSKSEIINFYLTSVRFERKVNGIISATNHFFPNKEDKNYSYEEAFFLIERLSNISSTYRIERIESLLARINSTTQINKEKLIKLYKEVEKNNAIQQGV
jgi:penicillin-binding protein 1A